jgi:hypothetical protein
MLLSIEISKLLEQGEIIDYQASYDRGQIVIASYHMLKPSILLPVMN